MAFKVFRVPLVASEQAEERLNSFLRSHCLLAVDRRWVEQGENSFWSFCVDYHESPTGNDGRGKTHAGAKARVDYREVLTPAEFARYSRLRDFRKKVAEEESVPLYTVFTNEQLANIARENVASASSLQKIEGIGEARLKKYGERLLAALKLNTGSGGDETGGKPV